MFLTIELTQEQERITSFDLTADICESKASHAATSNPSRFNPKGPSRNLQSLGPSLTLLIPVFLWLARGRHAMGARYPPMGASDGPTC